MSNKKPVPVFPDFMKSLPDNALIGMDEWKRVLGVSRGGVDHHRYSGWIPKPDTYAPSPSGAPPKPKWTMATFRRWFAEQQKEGVQA